ncbi:MAB_1171c family putative transporter [Nocardia sp. NPDC049149]|uniref:MAB_1171c family putative transporter n=1 Tax=Nocardia sp. NPDC049149 TaxID=3364315 RepID=UPI00371B3077
MTSPIPLSLAVPVIAFVGLVTLARRIVLHDTLIDRLLNRAMVWALLCLVLWQRSIAPQHFSLMHQLSMGAIMMMNANLYGTAKLWAGAEPDTARTRQWRYDLVGAATVVGILLAGTAARNDGRLIGALANWETGVVIVLMWVPLIACGRLAWRVATRELRSDGLATHERVVYGILLAAMLVGCGGLLITVVEFAGGRTVDDPMGVRWAASNYSAIFLAAAILAVPLVAALRSRAGWDRSGRACRKLEPLWRDLTAAVPEIVLAPHVRAGTDARLLRMTVEIRDALMHLHRYLPADEDTRRRPERYARLIARAIEAKDHGSEPSPRQPGHRTVDTGDIDSDVRQLLELAHVWNRDRPLSRSRGAEAGGRRWDAVRGT